MAWKGNSPNRDRGSRWRQLRAQVLREEPFCRWCINNGPGLQPRPSTICDHITPLAEGGTDERGNLAGMCQPCHNEKTAQEAARALGRKVKRRVAVDDGGWPMMPRTPADRRS